MAAYFATRVGRLAEVLSLLHRHPDGMRLSELARLSGIDVDELREDLLAFYSADDGRAMLGLSRPEVLEFLGPDGADQDPHEAEMVRAVSPDGGAEIGVEYLAAEELALIYTAAVALANVEPDDAHLASAIDALAANLAATLGEGVPDVGRDAPEATEELEQLRDAVNTGKRVRIGYSRSWVPGVGERVIEPYHLEMTRRGWEVDAGPVDDNGQIRTFLVSHVRSVEPTGETFTPPANLRDLVAASRVTTTVRMELRHDARWAADSYAEHVEVVGESVAGFTADLALLPPVETRVGLIMLAGGADTRVLTQTRLMSAGVALAEELYRHHQAT